MQFMPKLFLLVSLFVLKSTVFSQQEERPDADQEMMDLLIGDDTIRAKITGNDTTSSLLFVMIHDNEFTAQDAVDLLPLETAGKIVQLQNNGQRYISFSFKGRTHRFDPNRMFSRKGIIASMKLFDSYTPEAANEVEKFAFSFLQFLQGYTVVVSLHNNTEGKYSIKDYSKKGQFQKETRLVHINKTKDPDDFFITTNQDFFEALQKKDFNIVWQDNRKAADDGSLSYYYAHQPPRYINIEAQFYHLSEQIEMIEAFLSILNIKAE